MSVTAKKQLKHLLKTGEVVNLDQERRQAQAELHAMRDSLAVYRVGFFDIETTHLKGNFGHLICACVKEAGGETLTFRFDDDDAYPVWFEKMWDDSRLAEDIRQALEGFDLIVTYNGHFFDFPFCDTRLIKLDLPLTPKVHHVDLFWHAKKKLLLHSYSLEAVASHFQVPTSKTKVDPFIWLKAQYGDRESCSYIVEHCQRDVEVLEQVFTHMKPLIDVIWRRR